MLKTYIGPDSPVRVVVGGNDLGYVEHGEAIFVDDDVAAQFAWAEDLWRDGAPEAQEVTLESAVNDVEVGN